LDANRWLDATISLLRLSDDPRARSSATYTISGVLAQQADYAAARTWIDLTFEDAEKFGFEFALPLANWQRGHIALGQRRFAEADAAAQRIEDHAAASRDRLHEFNARTLRGRILLQSGNAEAALECLRADPDIPLIPSWRGDYVALRALAFAILGEPESALKDAQSARAISRCTEVDILALAAEAIAHLRAEDSVAHRLVDLSATTGVWDPLLCALRASQDLASRLAEDNRTRPQLTDLYQRSGDTGLARRAGIRIRATADPLSVLTEREQEVLELIALGYTNPNIAQALFISNSTAKVHTRHIFEKLGVRSRSAAVARLRMFQHE
jgi:ATP/maltotriose-dependent transcriptional regulator MalT